MVKIKKPIPEKGDLNNGINQKKTKKVKNTPKAAAPLSTAIAKKKLKPSKSDSKEKTEMIKDIGKEVVKEKLSKKKKVENGETLPEKAIPIKKLKPRTVFEDIAQTAKPLKTKKNSKLISKTVQEATPKENAVNKPLKTKGIEEVNGKKRTGKTTEKLVPKKPLVLAPIESPLPQVKKIAKKKLNQGTSNILDNEKETNANEAKSELPALSKSEKKKAVKRAFKKEQVKNIREGREKKQKPLRTNNFEALAFNEDTFNSIVNVDNVKKIAQTLKTTVEQQVAEKKTSIFSDYQYCLDVVSFKIPNCPKRMVKLNVKHSLVGEDDDVVIIVPDLVRGAKVDYDPTIQYYEDIFREAGVGVKLKIMPFNQLRNEYNTFEAVRKLSNTYDYFLCDGRVVGQVVGFCGKIFQKPRTTFHAVRMQHSNNLKNDINKSLHRTAYKQLEKGDLISIPVGSHKQTVKQVAENVEHVVSQLKTIFPGGLGNIRQLHMKINIVGTSSLPIYISMAQPPEETPFILGPREKRLLKMKNDANKVLTKFALTKEASIKRVSKDKIERKRKFNEAMDLLKADKEKDKQEAQDENAATTAKKARKTAKKDVAEKHSKNDSESDASEDISKLEETSDDDEAESN